MPFDATVVQLQYSPHSSHASNHPLFPSSPFPHNGSSLFADLAAASGVRHFLFHCHVSSSLPALDNVLRATGEEEGAAAGRVVEGNGIAYARRRLGGQEQAGEERAMEESEQQQESQEEGQWEGQWEEVASAEMQQGRRHIGRLMGGVERLHAYLEGVAFYTFSSEQLPGSLFDPSGRGFEGYIPGTVVRSGEQVRRFEAWQRGVAQEGGWVRDGTPRRQSWWSHNELDPTCDHRHVQAGGIAGRQADAVADRWQAFAAAHGEERGSQSFTAAKEKAEASWKVRESLKYVWQPRNQSVPWGQLDGRSLCPLANHKEGDLENERSLNILVLGDSLNEQLSISLVNALGLSVREPLEEVIHSSAVAECTKWLGNPVEWSVKQWCVQYRIASSSICPGSSNGTVSFNVVFLRHYYLHLSSHSHREGHMPWSRFQSTLMWADAVVLNRGAHITYEDDFRTGVRAALRFIRRLLPRTLLIFRSTAPGHANCSGRSTPLSAPQPSEGLPYNWHRFHAQNRMAEEEVRAVGGVFLDVEPMTGLRADGHRELNLAGRVDCLHYCEPGPVDWWAQLLLNTLLQLLPRGQ